MATALFEALQCHLPLYFWQMQMAPLIFHVYFELRNKRCNVIFDLLYKKNIYVLFPFQVLVGIQRRFATFVVKSYQGEINLRITWESIQIIFRSTARLADMGSLDQKVWESIQEFIQVSFYPFPVLFIVTNIFIINTNLFTLK